MKNRFILRELSKAAMHEEISVEAREHAQIFIIATSTSDYTLTVDLKGKEASADILGVVIGRKTDTIKIRTLQKHSAPDTTSDLHIKSVLFDDAVSDYAGFIRVEVGAQKSNAYQRNDNLMLSSDAHALSNPGLEILANDVRCTHGATIGKINDEQLFYLQSRGITKEMAEQMIVSGFLEVLAEKIRDPKNKDMVVKKVSKFLV